MALEIVLSMIKYGIGNRKTSPKKIKINDADRWDIIAKF